MRQSFLLFLMFTGLSSFAQSPSKDSPHKAILSSFEEWKEKQFASGEFARPGNCHPGLYSDNENYNGPDMGLPDEFKVIYTDINLDEKQMP